MADAHTTEEFREIPDLPGYRVSNLGRIQTCLKIGKPYRTFTSEWRDRKPSQTRRGHLQLIVRRKEKVHAYYVHRLVLELFVGPCPEGMECCHNNGKPDDNRLSNLRWDTHKNNGLDSIRHGACKNNGGIGGERHGNAKLKDAEIDAIRERYSQGSRVIDLAKQYGVSATHICRIVHRQSRV